MNKLPNIYIATPMYGGVCSGQYTSDLLNLSATFLKKRWKCCFRYIINESLITRARNNLVHNFLNHELQCTHLLFIDADISGFSGNDVCKMIEADVDVIAGVYPTKNINWSAIENNLQFISNEADMKKISTTYVFNQKPDTTRNIESSDDIIEVDNVGTGFMLIKRQVFEKLSKHVQVYINDSIGSELETTYNFYDTSIDDEYRVLLSEDYHFCKSWTDIGGKIYIAPWVDLKHTGNYTFG